MKAAHSCHESSARISTLKLKLAVAAPKQIRAHRAISLVKRWRVRERGRAIAMPRELSANF
ncbi:hypothetical protein BN2475_240032 [Paraburkholderia ribeironis]|uniref:Uncharacterized protein n=1 Tax=Paraburkholderia ribeironis TaxID=1247936 RepID=A0A1N7RY40_9BURK|nr:hypothetical protein BN2475_240032 [Paraburkholderia ribeironis]